MAEFVEQALERWRSLRSQGPRGLAVAVLAMVLTGAILLFMTRPEPLPDFATIEQVDERKQAFFGFLAPRVREANDLILEERARLLAIAAAAEAGSSPGWFDRRWLARMSKKYEVHWNPDAPLAELDVLKRRIDIVPVSLALVQAATESGWGRSRFAVDGNNLFGHWCYQAGCGIVPSDRPSGARHEVAAFDSVHDSVRRYLWNLNTHEAYRPVREIRARLRGAEQPLTAMALAEGLARYSERREDYVEEIKTALLVNQWLLESLEAPSE
jgi:Bax protein